eukprot:6213346-Pleurochrysis_carterae.AAC.8
MDKCQDSRNACAVLHAMVVRLAHEEYAKRHTMEDTAFTLAIPNNPNYYENLIKMAAVVRCNPDTMRTLAQAEAFRICTALDASKRYEREMSDKSVKGNLAWGEVGSDRAKGELTIAPRCLSHPHTSDHSHLQRLEEIRRRRDPFK